MGLETVPNSNEHPEIQPGRLKIFFGYAAGVGKSYKMLAEAQTYLKAGNDVVIGSIGPNLDESTRSQANEIPAIPLKTFHRRGNSVVELDLDGILARHPDLVLIDELAHTNPTGMRHPHRYLDIHEILDSGIDVFTTLNVQNLESLKDVVRQITGITTTETVPDHVLDNADEIEIIDLSPDDLLSSLRQNQGDSVDWKFFRKGNLNALRQLCLRVAAGWVDVRMRDYMNLRSIPGPWPASERLMVAISSHPLSERLVRVGRRLATDLNAEWFAVYVETPERVKFSPVHSPRVANTLKLAETLGAKVVTLQGHTVPEAIIDFAHHNNITKIIAGKPKRPRWYEWVNGSVINEIIRQSGSIDVYVINDETGQVTLAIPEVFQPRESWKNYLLSTLIVALTTLLAVPLHYVIQPTNLAILYLLDVLVIAVYLGRGPSILGSLLGVLSFDYFFVNPRFSLDVTDTQYLITFFGLLAVGLVISNLTALLHDQVENTTKREAQTAALYNLSRDLTTAIGLEKISKVIIGHISQNLSRDVAILLPDGEQLTIRASSSNFEMTDDEVAAAHWSFSHDTETGRGTDTHSNCQGRFFPLRTSLGVVGVMGVKPVDATSYLTPNQHHLMEGFASLAALAIERGQLAEAAGKAQLLSATERLQTALLNSISHDLRTPLVSITGVLSSLKEAENQEMAGLDSATRMELIDTALGESERLNRLVGNLLDMTRLEAGALQIKREPCDFQDLIGTALGQRKKQMQGRTIVTQIQEDLPLVPADYVLLTQVLLNLLDNAIKYSPAESPIEVHAWVESNGVNIRVGDRGYGVPAEDLERIFGKFYRVQRKDSPAGTGLGLSICRGIVEAHKGKIWAADRPGSGLDVTLRIPLQKPDGG
jgi:two-component system, OmpR family, sensor histidine kinase KdpD